MPAYSSIFPYADLNIVMVFAKRSMQRNNGICEKVYDIIWNHNNGICEKLYDIFYGNIIMVICEKVNDII